MTRHGKDSSRVHSTKPSTPPNPLAGGCARVESSRVESSRASRTVGRDRIDEWESTTARAGGDDDERLDGWVTDAGAIGARARFGPWSSRKRVKEERAFVVVVVGGGVGGVVRLSLARGSVVDRGEWSAAR